MSDRTEELRAIRDAIVHLSESPLYEYRTRNNYFPVIGQGSHYARIMFIGEAPGKNEAETGRPFVGAAGRLLDEMIASIGIKRDDVYITNIVKDRPPENRDPRPEEIELYAPFLVRQIEIIQPQVIATLGRFSMEFILRLVNMPEASQKISMLHGNLLNARAEYGPIHIVTLFHPAAALYKASDRELHFQDFQVLKQFTE